MIGAAARGSLLALLLLAAQAVPAVCTCATSRTTNGWCAVHAFGYVAGVKITSEWLYETLDAHGHDVDLSTFICPSCKSAIAASGFCDEHRVGFVGGRAYFSRLTYELARGTVLHPSEISCATCRKNSETHGWCDRDRVGMVGPYAIADRAAYDRAVHQVGILEVANAAAERCRYCAAAIVTDTQCPVCRIRYKDGKAEAK